MTFWWYVADFLRHLWALVSTVSILGILWMGICCCLYTRKNNDPSLDPFIYDKSRLWILLIDIALVINWLIVGLVRPYNYVLDNIFKESDTTCIWAALFVCGVIILIIKSVLILILYNRKCKTFSLSKKKKVKSAYSEDR